MQVIEELLIGDYKIIQDDARYRFTSDSVLLARFLQAKKGFFGVFMRLIIIYASLKKETINRPPYIGRPKIYRRALVGHGGIRVILFWVFPPVFH